MRLVLYLGTRSCKPTLEDAIDGYHDALAILVPADPRLVGSHLSGEQVTAGLGEIAEIVRSRALDIAVSTARREAEDLAGVFDQEPIDPTERIQARAVEGDLLDGLDAFLDARDAEVCYVSRDALDILSDASIRPGDVLEPRDVDLVAR